jgi:uncharacterized membrane protein
VNDRSELVGFIGVNGPLDANGTLLYYTTAAYWRNGGKAPVLLGALGGQQSFARAITNSGQIVGLAETDTGDVHAFLIQRQ